MANIDETERKAVGMADGILAAVNENGNIDRFIDTKGGVHYIEPKRYEESVAKIDAAATKAKETVNSATEAVSECKAQTGACTQETARAKEIADTVESRITGIEGDIATLRDSVSRSYFSSEDTDKLTVVAPRDCTIEVEAWYENQWGYDGKGASIALRCPPGLVELVRVDGRIYGGNTVGRSMHAMLVASGARSGESYTFTVNTVQLGTTGTKHIVARCL